MERPPRPPEDTPARRHTVEALLAWGAPRPVLPEGLADRLATRIQVAAGLGGTTGSAAVSGASSASVPVLTRARMERSVCTGWQHDPLPFAHTRANARGILTGAAIRQDLLEGVGTRPAAAVVAGIWHDEASRHPGDPSSRSAWLNRQPAAEAADLREEVTELLDGFREVWPPLPAGAVEPRVGVPLTVRLAGGRVVLRGAPDLVLRSRVRDPHARTLVVDLRTGRPRPQLDRIGRRFHALLETLATGRAPFRWASLHVTDGRSEVEDLDPAALEEAADRVAATWRQLASGSDEPDPHVLTGAAAAPVGTSSRLRAGAWCHACARLGRCEVADAAGVSQGPATMPPAAQPAPLREDEEEDR